MSGALPIELDISMPLTFSQRFTKGHPALGYCLVRHVATSLQQGSNLRASGFNRLLFRLSYEEVNVAQRVFRATFQLLEPMQLC